MFCGGTGVSRYGMDKYSIYLYEYYYFYLIEDIIIYVLYKNLGSKETQNLSLIIIQDLDKIGKFDAIYCGSNTRGLFIP